MIERQNRDFIQSTTYSNIKHTIKLAETNVKTLPNHLVCVFSINKWENLQNIVIGLCYMVKLNILEAEF